MGSFAAIYKSFVAALVLMIGICLPVAAQEVDIGELLADLADPEAENWQSIERQIVSEWSRSGSASIDFLLQRGHKALEAEDYQTALEHFMALTDHAPDFAEGWNGRATALYRMELFGPALEDIGRVLALNPNHFGAITGLAVILQQTGDDKGALEVWRILKTIHPHLPQLQDAIESLEKATEGSAI